MTELEIELGHPEDAELLKLCAEKLGANYLKVTSLKRFGYSGAELFLTFPGDGEQLGYPHVVKIGTKSQIDEEEKGVEEVRIYFRDAKIEASVATDERAAIIIPLIEAARNDTKTAPLEEQLCHDLAQADSAERLRKILTSVYDGCCHQAHRGKRTVFTLGEEYERYRREDRSADRLAIPLGGDLKDEPFPYLNAQVVDPRFAVEKLKDMKVEGVFGAVHGDLHSSNVMLDHNDEPHLIDFAWAKRKGHVLKDFILMECSLRFLVFPSYADLETQLKVDGHLLERSGWEMITTIDQNLPLADCYRRLGALIGAIRNLAAQVSGPSFDFEREYLAPQLYVLYGLLKYDGYAFHAASRAAGMIAKKLCGPLL